jgi:DNA-binding transcriptional MerR regulator
MNVRILTLFDEEPISPSKLPKAKDIPAIKKELPQSTEKSQITNRASAKTHLKSPDTDESEKNYYTIGQTALKFKVRTSHIRFWTVQFALKVRTTRKGDRLYTPENIEQLKLIHHLVKEQGFTIAGAKIKLKELKGKATKEPLKDDVIGTLKNLRLVLLSLKNQIDLL